MPGEPTLSGINDALLGGSTNMAPDREAARAITARFPAVPEMAAAGHAFSLRTARWAAGELGIRNFIRAGYVTPLEGANVHAAVREVARGCRVVYVTRGDQAAAAIGRMADGENVTVARARVAHADEVLAAEPVAAMLSEKEPAALIIGCLMHHAPPQGAREQFAAYAAALPPGSVLAASLIATSDEQAAAELGELFGVEMFTHTPDGCAGWLDGARACPLTPRITVPGTALGVVARIP